MIDSKIYVRMRDSSCFSLNSNGNATSDIFISVTLTLLKGKRVATNRSFSQPNLLCVKVPVICSGWPVGAYGVAIMEWSSPRRYILWTRGLTHESAWSSCLCGITTGWLPSVSVFPPSWLRSRDVSLYKGRHKKDWKALFGPLHKRHVPPAWWRLMGGEGLMVRKDLFSSHTKTPSLQTLSLCHDVACEYVCICVCVCVWLQYLSQFFYTQ